MINSLSVILILLPGCLLINPYFAVGGVIPIIVGLLCLFKISNVLVIYVVISYLIYLAICLIIYYVLPKLSIVIKTILAQLFFIIFQGILITVLNYVIRIQPESLHNQL
jgi:hypothetical protein